MNIFFIILNCMLAGIALEQVRHMDHPAWRILWGGLLFMTLLGAYLHFQKIQPK